MPGWRKVFLYRLLSKCPGVLSERFLRVGMARAVEAVRFLRKFETTVGQTLLDEMCDGVYFENLNPFVSMNNSQSELCVVSKP